MRKIGTKTVIVNTVPAIHAEIQSFASAKRALISVDSV
jgi:hypothetical protein